MSDEFDPKLKDAVTEIDLILRRYDIAGAVMLASKTHAEYYFAPNPTWSAITISNKELRLNTKKFPKQHKGDVARLTSHLVAEFRGLCWRGFCIFSYFF